MKTNYNFLISLISFIYSIHFLSAPVVSFFLSVRLENLQISQRNNPGRHGILLITYTSKFCRFCFTQPFLSIFNVKCGNISKFYTKYRKFTQALLARLRIIPCLIKGTFGSVWGTLGKYILCTLMTIWSTLRHFRQV